MIICEEENKKRWLDANLKFTIKVY